MADSAAERNRPAGLDLVVDALACPICGDAVERLPSSLHCGQGHSFDVARHGYASLLSGARRARTADTAEMVAARERLLGTGCYSPLATAIVAATRVSAPGLVVDIAGGTGYYLASVLDAHPGAMGMVLDLSPFALRRAARAHPRAAAIAANAWAPLPVRTAGASVVLSVFGPRHAAEISRILRPHGALVVAAPTTAHLAELVGPFELLAVDPQKAARLDRSLAAFERVSDQRCEYSVELRPDEVADVVLMGPSSHHLDRARFAERIAELPERTRVTISVTISVRTPRAAG